MHWTTTPPTVSGQYWAWGPGEYHEGQPSLWCLSVNVSDGKIDLDFDVDGYEWEARVYPQYITHWMGPIPPPEPPVVLDGRQPSAGALAAAGGVE